MILLVRLHRVVISLVFLLITVTAALGQATAGFGDWQLHLPINRAKALADVGNRVYVATEDAFFYFDKELTTTRLLSRRDGLHDVGVSTLAYDSVTQQVVVAYRSGNLDLLRLSDGAILNLNDIARKELPGAKTINQISINNKTAYLACSFGIVAVDLVKLEIRDSYTNIGPGGTVVEVYSTAAANGVLVAATSAGVLRARLTDNLLDYRVWVTDFAPRAGSPFRTLGTHNGVVYLGINGDQLYGYNPSQPAQGWRPVAGVTAVEFRQLASSRAGLLVTDNQKVVVLNPATGVVTTTLRPALLQNPRAALRAKDGRYYLADFANGLLRVSADGQQAEQFITNAPASTKSYSVLADARTNTVDIFSGAYGDRYLQERSQLGFYEYTQGQWTNISSATLTGAQYPNLLDPVRGTRTPDGTLYVASYGNGLLEWKGPGNFRLFNPTAGLPNPLRSTIADPSYTRVTDVATAPDGKVWVVNRHQLVGLSGLFVFDPAVSTWATVPYFSGSENLERIAFDDVGGVWLSRARAPTGTTLGIVAYNLETRTTRSFLESDGLPSGEIYDVVKDRRGDIWVATIKGPAVFNDPISAFDPSSGLVFQTPFVRRGEGTGFAALRDEAVRAIAVDGGNRKWFATDRGLWLFNEDATEALEHFTTANSPLPSDRVVDVEVNDKTGEVFVATDAGVVAYRGSATVTEGKPSCAKVSPNPVRTNLTGQVGISGLANNAQVKITDVTGKLVYQTRASGGTLVWNLTDYNGRKVQSGVYLVLSSDADGKNGCISKVAVVEK
ncbi:T9SS type A sorting domain-containing protein [Hymenobacter taeanensis]|uniref:T9SS type A sorting domain-containing protein n=1 Tax=Hymenobacter taeanensis TaxID=2735321 RepID=A0A6M6BJL9_9BACT|nr:MULTISPECIES: two-component regulator propeller domain-containing protein [Hymenobacter]QJX47265.1 T9SS type A sorting domain-containing protein [Hymenobacter taeanensis]UOQ79399.1 PQQ-binding-like beta-propeller repeat protein [Hymenobacter sp. 5414T-23]